MKTAVLGLDVGTTTCKAVLVDQTGDVMAAAVVPYPAGSAAEDPAVWWETVALATGQIRRRLRRVRLAALAVCGRGSGLAFIDMRGRALSPAWTAGRADRSKIGAPGPYSKVARWGRAYRVVARTSPREASRIAAILSVKDFVAFRLTGVPGADPSSASCLAWPRVPERYGLPGAVLPVMRPMQARLGTVTAEAARTLGLPAGVPVAVGGHDGVCANIGAGALRVGEGCLTLGTNGVVRINTARAIYSNRTLATFTYPFLGDVWTSGGDAAGAGAAMLWLGRVLGYQTGDAAAFHRAHQELDALAADVPTGAGGVLFLPFLKGMVSPHLQPDVAAAFAGLRQEHGPGHLVRAVMEGGALALRDILERFARRAPCPGPLRVTGGGTRSRLWPQILATAIGRPLGLVDIEPSARGAAILAAVAAGLWPDVPTAAARMTRETGKVRPVAAEQEVYALAARRFRILVREAVVDGRRARTRAV